MMVETSVGLPASDVRVVRDLAARLAEIAALPVQAARVREWEALNDLRPARPMAMIDEIPFIRLPGRSTSTGIETDGSSDPGSRRRNAPAAAMTSPPPRRGATAPTPRATKNVPRVVPSDGRNRWTDRRAMSTQSSSPVDAPRLDPPRARP